MRIDEIVSRLRQSPFRPFRLMLTTGESYDVHQPESIAVGRTRLAISSPENDLFAHVSLRTLTCIEEIQPDEITESANG